MDSPVLAIAYLKNQIFRDVESTLEEMEIEEGYEFCEKAYLKALGHCHYDMVNDFINSPPLSEIEKFINAYGVYEAMKVFTEEAKDRQGKVDMALLTETKESFYRQMTIEVVFKEMNVSYAEYRKCMGV